MLKVKLFDVTLAELPRDATLAEHLERLVNDFLASKAHVEIVRTHMNTAVLPGEDGGGLYKESPASVVVIMSIFYRE